LSDPLAGLLTDLLGALQRGREEGGARLYDLMTERARAPLNDPAGAVRALGNELLAPLVGHRAHRSEPWERLPGVARTRFTVTGASTPATYLISLRQGADGGWRITGLRRDDLPWS
jgi:hypothetical protein